MLRVKRAKQNSYRTIILGVFFILSSVRSVHFNHPKIQTVFLFFLIHCSESSLCFVYINLNWNLV